MSGGVFKRLADSPFGRRFVSNEPPNSFKKFKDATFRQFGFGTYTEKPQDNCPTTTLTCTLPRKEGASRPSSSQDVLSDLQRREHTIDSTTSSTKQDSVDARVRSIDGKENPVQDETSNIELNQHEISIRHQATAATSVRSTGLSVSVHTPEDNCFPEPALLSRECPEEGDKSGILMPHEMIRNWNHIYHCDRKIKDRVKSLKEYEEMQLEASKQIEKLLDDFAKGVPKESHEEHLQKMSHAKEEVVEEITRLEEKLFMNRNDLPRFERAFFDNWEKFMRTKNLVRVPSTASLGSIVSNEAELEAQETYQDYEPFEPDYMEPDMLYVPIEPTASETAEWHAAALQEEAKEVLAQKGVRLADSQAKLEDWWLHCEDKRADFLQRGVPVDEEAAIIEFDLELVMEKGQATHEWIEAEKDLEETKAYYRDLGVYLEDDYQESNFQDLEDDGIYLDDKGNRTVKFMDRAWIKKWVDQQRELCIEIGDLDENHSQTKEEIEEEVSEYLRIAREVETWDSCTCVALDGARRRIDHWRDVCENWPPNRNKVAIV